MTPRPRARTLLCAALALAAGPAAADCAGMTGYADPAFPDLTITAATPVAEGTPHCLVEGAFERRTGVDGKDYAIGFALALPDDWNGRFLMQGGGGLNGSVRPPEGPTAAGDQTALARGFAVVSHDSGHKGEVFDASFKADQIAAMNFSQGAVEKVTRLGKAMVADYYGRPADHSYFTGCSTGGREGMMAMQRLAPAYDGVLVGAPAMRTNNSNGALAVKASAMNALAPQAADGTPDRAAVFADTGRQVILDGILAACDAQDGLADGMVQDITGCGFDPAALVCTAGQNAGCLSAEQAELAATILGPTTDSTGFQLYPGYPADTGIMVSDDRSIPGLFRFEHPRNFQARNADPALTADRVLNERIRADSQQWLVDTDRWTNLSSFAGQGGKVIFFHGASDPWFSAFDTLDYYRAVEGQAEDFAAFYMVPGMGHCGGGPQALDTFDLLTPLVAWVEEGTAPGPVEATGEAFPGRSRPLCPFPQVARYQGGDEDAAASFACE